MLHTRQPTHEQTFEGKG